MQNTTPHSHWQARQEGGSRFMLSFIRTLALRVSPRAARALLYPITLYYLLLRGAERRASRNYLRRVLHREPTLRDIARHIHTFAATILDRVFLLSGRFDVIPVRIHGVEALHVHLQQGRGIMLLGAHFGSFDAVRALGVNRDDFVMRIVMDYQHNAKLASVLDTLNPRLRDSVIDAAQDSTTLLLKIHDTLTAGGIVGMLADRLRGTEPHVTVSLLGDPVCLPVAPLRVAATAGSVVMLIFGVRQRDGSYDIHFEEFAERITLERAIRARQLCEWMQRYAARVEAQVRQSPYNWFNFYEFWTVPAHADAPPDRR